MAILDSRVFFFVLGLLLGIYAIQSDLVHSGIRMILAPVPGTIKDRLFLDIPTVLLLSGSIGVLTYLFGDERAPPTEEVPPVGGRDLAPEVALRTKATPPSALQTKATPPRIPDDEKTEREREKVISWVSFGGRRA
ncbi:hypothetical protein PTKIN_Ptkin04bG0027700 [Pterospermum kingtungense]